jgi:predicted glycoside hydrolase/deacetylase ChbG (UPF0249 family)
MENRPVPASIIITADDLGYHPRYDEGIARAAGEGLIDAAGAMVGRPGFDPELAAGLGVELGLHLELDGSNASPRAGASERAAAARAIDRQLDRFGALLGDAPAYLDGHHHCHAREGLGSVVADAAAAVGCAVRSVGPRHRRLLRCRGIPTPDRLIGRGSELEPALPPELTGTGPGEGVTEWMVHPGLRGGGSSYDAGREQDLELLRTVRLPAGVTRTTHRHLPRADAGGDRA